MLVKCANTCDKDAASVITTLTFLDQYQYHEYLGCPDYNNKMLVKKQCMLLHFPTAVVHQDGNHGIDML